MNVKDLINFENDIAETFNEGKIKAPIHLYSDNEKLNLPPPVYTIQFLVHYKIQPVAPNPLI